MSNLPIQKATNKFKATQMEVGRTFEIEAGSDRVQYIERTLERLKNERLKNAELECDALLRTAEKDAAAVRARAQEEAREIIAAGEARRDEVLQQGYAEGEQAGFQKGYADSCETAQAECLKLIESSKTILRASYEAQDRMLRRYQTTMANMTLAMVKRILQTELTQNPQAVDALIHQAITQLRLTGQIKVVASESVVSSLMQFNETTQTALNSIPHLTIEPDPQLGPYDIYVVGESAQYVLNPENQAETLMEAIKPQLPETVLSSDLEAALLDISADLSDELSAEPSTETERPASERMASTPDLAPDSTLDVALEVYPELEAESEPEPALEADSNPELEA